MLAFLLAVMNLPDLDPEPVTTPAAHIGQRLSGDSDAVAAALRSPASIGDVNIAPVCSFGATPLASDLLGDVSSFARPLTSPQCGLSGLNSSAVWSAGPSLFLPFAGGAAPFVPAFSQRVSVPVLRAPFAGANTPTLLRSASGEPGSMQVHAVPHPEPMHAVHIEARPAPGRR